MKVIEVFCCMALYATLASGVEIDCWYRMTNWIPGGIYICGATITNVEDPTTVRNINGTHLAGRSNEDVRGFSVFLHDILTTIPTGIEKFFANLELFAWDNGNISTIDSSTFKPFPSLLFISLGNNKLISLDGDLLQHSRKLREIEFHGNLLEHVGHDLLTGLTDLTYADFESNPCINIRANTPEAIQELNRQLPIKCPLNPIIECPTTCMIDEIMDRIAELERADPQTTTISAPDPNECPSGCASNVEVRGMERQIRDEMKSMVKEVQELKEMIVELQRQMKDRIEDLPVKNKFTTK